MLEKRSAFLAIALVIFAIASVFAATTFLRGGTSRHPEPPPLAAPTVDVSRSTKPEPDPADVKTVEPVLAIKSLTERLDHLIPEADSFSGSCASLDEAAAVVAEALRVVESWKGKLEGSDPFGNRFTCLDSREKWTGVSQLTLEEEMQAFHESRAKSASDAPMRRLRDASAELRDISIKVITIGMTDPALQAMSCVELQKMEYLSREQDEILNRLRSEIGGC